MRSVIAPLADGLLATFLIGGFALLPMLVIFVISQVAILRLPAEEVRRITLGMIYCFVGLVIFLLGVNGGFTPTGRELGTSLGSIVGGWVLIPVGFILGAVIVCAEPAVWVLTGQVEEVSGGTIKRGIMMAALSISVAFAVALGMLRVVTDVGSCGTP